MRAEIALACRSLLRAGDTVVCGVSGGADSVCMLHVMLSLQKELGVTVEAAHFNHRLRGAESDRDEEFVRGLCKKLCVPLTVGSGDVAARARKRGESAEEAARNLRYEFFDTLPHKIATAHTADDNLETILINLVRGTALKGLGGIPPVRGRIIRPMLTVTRAQIIAYLDENDLPHVEDSTNAQDDCLRNRLRHRVIPLLKEENPSLLAGTSRMAELLRQDEALLDARADALLEKSRTDGGFSVEELRQSPAPLRRRSLRRALRICHAPKLSAGHIAAVEALLFSADPSAGVCLPGGWTARRIYGKLTLERSPAESGFAPVALPCPGSAYIPELGVTVTCEWADAGAGGMILRKDVAEGLMLRPRETGDRIRLRGGSRELKKLMIDRKIPAALRSKIPVVTAFGKVAAVCGVGVSTEFLARPDETGCRITLQTDKGEAWSL